MSLVLTIAAMMGALGVYWMLPHDRSMPRPGAALAAGALAVALVAVLLRVGSDAATTVHMGLFTFISAAASVRVITHKRPVFSALYFVLVVLSTSGMLVLLEAEFMAFAMVIIYGGAILVTYMFVIMLATSPQPGAEGEAVAPVYDRYAREPVAAVIMGFALVAVLSSVIVRTNVYDETSGGASASLDRPHVVATQPAAMAASMPGKLRVDDVNENTRRVTELERVLRQQGKIGPRDHVWDVKPVTSDGVTKLTALVAETEGASSRVVTLDDEALGRFVTNIDQIGLNLFQGHTLGIELAAIILLLSMVGAIVIARQRVPESPSVQT